MSPVTVWLPSVKSEQFKQHGKISNTQIDAANTKISTSVKQSIELFGKVSNELNNPNDILMMLPMGVYVDFDLVISVDHLLSFLIDLDTIKVYGVSHLTFAFADLLAPLVSESK